MRRGRRVNRCGLQGTGHSIGQQRITFDVKAPIAKLEAPGRSVAAIEAAPVALAGSAAGTQSMMRYFGSITGVGLLSGLLTTGAGGTPDISVFRSLYVLVAILLGLSVVAASLIRPASRGPA